jgi:transposase
VLGNKGCSNEGVVSPAAPIVGNQWEARMRRVIGIDLHRTFGEVVIWENGVLRYAGRVDMTRTALEGFCKSLRSTDEVVIEATGNSLALSRVLTSFVRRVIIANPLQVKAIAQAHVDRQD